jgi:ankyrin repeat protein
MNLIEAARSGYLETAKKMVESGADIHAENDYALRWAASYGHLDVVMFLVQSGADIHAENDYAFRSSASNGHLDVSGTIGF